MYQLPYFAYGSNLNFPKLEDFLERHGLNRDEISPICSGTLLDQELVFNYFSQGRGGGALNLKPRLGQTVDGMLFSVSPAAWVALDRKEGAPHVYKRVEVPVVTADGRSLRAITYVVPNKPADGFFEPTSAYKAEVQAGMEDFDIDPGQMLAAADNTRPNLKIPGLFVYGTLMRDEARFGLLAQSGLETCILAETPGQLYDCGDYPALRCLDLGGEMDDDLVAGDFCIPGDLSRILVDLDRLEGFRGHGSDGNLYSRRLVPVHVGEGRLREAWTYEFAHPTSQLQPIESRDWRAHRGSKQTFLERLFNAHVRETADIVAKVNFAAAGPLGPSETFTDIEKVRQAFLAGKLSERKLAQGSEIWAAIPA